MRLAAAAGAAVGVSFCEIYRGQVLDLLRSRAKMDVCEDGRGHVTLVGLREVAVESAEGMLTVTKQAEELRAVGATSANEASSRSHAILQVVLRELRLLRASPGRALCRTAVFIVGCVGCANEGAERMGLGAFSAARPWVWPPCCV